MMSGQIGRIHVVGQSPEARMIELGNQYRQIMEARVKALNSGMTAIHDALVALSRGNVQEQKALLAAHPELMLLATKQKVGA